MNKITPDHLARSACVYVRDQRPISLPTIQRVAAVNTLSQLRARREASMASTAPAAPVQ